MGKRDNKNSNNGLKRDYSSFDKPPSYYKNSKPTVNTVKRPKKISSKKKPAPTMEKNRGRRSPRSKPPQGSEIIVLTISLILFAASIGGSLLNFLTKEKIATMVVPYGSVDIPRLVTGIIIRDEKIYTASASGEIVYTVADGEKVRKDAFVCSIEDPNASSTLQAQSEELSAKIIEMQNLRGEISAVSTEVNAINQRMQAEINSSLLKLSSSDFSELYSLKDSLNTNLDSRNEKLLSENGGAVKPLVNELRQYTGKIDESRAPIYASEGGIVSYIVDGYEDELNFDNMSEITKEQTQMKVSQDSFTISKNVAPDDVVFKIIESTTWYIASYIDSTLIYDWSENDTVKLFLEKNGDYIEHDFKIDTLREGESESFVLLESDKQVSDFLDMRTISFKTYDSVYSGIKIPEAAICERTFLKIPASYVSKLRDNDIVKKRTGDVVETIMINTKALRNKEYDENYVYIMQNFDDIKRGDTIVSSETDEEGYVIDEIETSKGVFRTNSGLANFISISTEGMVTGNKGYVILDSENNSFSGGIKLYDRIISDASNNFIMEGDIIN